MIGPITPRRVLFWLITLGVFYVALCYLQMYYYAAQFNDFVDSEMALVSSRETVGADVQAQIYDGSKRFGIELEPQDIEISNSQDPAKGVATLVVDVNYVVPVHPNPLQLQVHFHKHATAFY